MEDDFGYSPLTPDSDNSTKFPPGPLLQPVPVPPVPASPDNRLPTLVPHVTPPAAILSPQGSLATASSQQPGAGPFCGGGPTGKDYVIPPRPKPGRKPATDEPASKRKAQNRESQRNFRARKAAKVKDLQDRLSNTQDEYEAVINGRLAEMAHMRDTIRCLQEEKVRRDREYVLMEKDRNYWRDHYQLLCEDDRERKLLLQQSPMMNGMHFPNHPYQQNPVFEARQEDSPSSANAYSTPKTDIVDGCGGCKPNGECPCITDIANQVTLDDSFEPAVPLPARSTMKQKEEAAETPNAFSELEIDFTTKSATRQTYPDPRTSIDFMTDNEHESCGFCTDVSNCACRDTSLQVSAIEDDMSAVAPSLMQGPGSCADCQSNPKQRAWCQRVAQLRDEATPTTSRRSSNASDTKMSNSLDIMEPRVDSRIDMNAKRASPIAGERSIGCSEAFKLLDGRVPMESDRMDWAANLKPMPHDARRDIFTMEPRLYSAMELDAADIITTLGNSRETLLPRLSDGKNADIIRLAEEFRRSSNSPHTAPGDRKPSAVESFNIET